MVALIIVAGGAGYIGLNSAIMGAIQYRSLARESALAGKLGSNMLMLNTAIKEYLIDPGEQRVWDFDLRWALTKRLAKQARKEGTTLQLKAILDNADATLDKFHQGFERLRKLDTRRLEIESSGRANTATLQEIALERKDLLEALDIAGAKITSSVEHVRESIKTRQEAVGLKLQRSFRNTVIVVGVATVAEIVIALLVALLFVRMITRPVGELEQIVKRSPSVAFRTRAEPGWPVDYVSENVVQFGYPPDDFHSGRTTFSDIIHPDDRSSVMAKISEHSEETSLKDFAHEYRITTGSGETRWVDERMWITRKGKGRVSHYEGILLDITDRKLTEEKLEEERAERAFIRETFGSYLSDDVVAEILESPEGVNLGGELRDLSILVSDLRGFSAMTERMDSRQVVRLINTYLEKMTSVIVNHQGTIDEFMGDGILVFFGAPRLFDDHPRRAVACALAMQQAMPEVNRENTSRGLPELHMGIGINCGELVVGNIGSQKRKKYGAVGSAINLAYRIEAQTSGGEILVSPEIYNRLSEHLVIESTRNVDLKGIEGTQTLHHVIGLTGGKSH